MSDLPESLPSQNPLAGEPLTSIEARVLGCLIEKQATTPETYPLTLNAAVLACNQKTAASRCSTSAPAKSATPCAASRRAAWPAW